MMYPSFDHILLSEGTISDVELAEASRLADSAGTKLYDEIVKLGYASPEKVLVALSRSLGIRIVDLTAMVVPKGVIKLVPESMARKHTMLPIARRDNAILVAACDSSLLEIQQELFFVLGTTIELRLALREQIKDAIEHHYGRSARSLNKTLADTTLTPNPSKGLAAADMAKRTLLLFEKERVRSKLAGLRQEVTSLGQQREQLAAMHSARTQKRLDGTHASDTLLSPICDYLGMHHACLQTLQTKQDAVTQCEIRLNELTQQLESLYKEIAR